MKKKSVSEAVRGILANIEAFGDKALFAYSKKFDGCTLTAGSVEVPASEINSAYLKLEPDTRRAIGFAAANIRSFHAAELSRIAKTWMIKARGIKRGQIVTPIRTAGIYVPGGRYPYPSTVLMAAIPAKVAGVGRIIMVSPPKNITPAVLFAAKAAGVDSIFRVGGPAAIGALAFGTKTIPKVDIIVGTGNAYVNEAKRQVYGLVGIDSLAGPSEVTMIADAGAPVEYIAADVRAQLEHDERAFASVLSLSKQLTQKLKGILGKDVEGRLKIITVTVKQAIEIVNSSGPEHLELLVKDTAQYLRGIKNAGAVFAGYATPAALGDYLAGPSHVLPTRGNARFSSGLSVASFLKRSSYIEYSQKAVGVAAPYGAILAGAEGMACHKDSINVRKRRC